MTDLTPMVTATIDYEDWLRRQVDVVEADLHLKHRQMASSLFTFLRATFYRWGFALEGDLPRSRRDSASVGGWGPACGKFWYLARQGREAGLGRQ
jgi:hypothetical protein